MGGIGAGKSAAAKIFERLGAAVIDSDRLAHEQLSNPEVVSVLRTWWGKSVVTAEGVIDRTAVAQIVFQRKAELAKLEALLYPRIEKRRLEIMSALQADPNVKAFVLDSPKLIEAGLAEICDFIVFVYSDYACRLGRVTQSRGWSDQELNAREKNQSPLDYKRKQADYVVDNNSDLQALRSQLERVFSSILASQA